MKHADFVHLHVHTQYSLLDGTIRLDDLFQKSKEYHNAGCCDYRPWKSLRNDRLLQSMLTSTE